MKEKFVFPERGFYVVVDKIAEADFFLEKLKSPTQSTSYYYEYNFYFSAFISAARSITFCLQWVMSKYPNFDEWYPPQQTKLQKSKLAKFFVDLRNYNQKTGLNPIGIHSKEGSQLFEDFFVTPNVEDIEEATVPDLTTAAELYLIELLTIISACYTDYATYVNPNTIFTEQGLEKIGWTIEDIEEMVGLPRGYTDIEWPEHEKSQKRLDALRPYGGDDIMSEFFEKYNIKYTWG